jgi:hypothetical protein
MKTKNLIVALLILLACSLQAQERVQGTKVTIDPPADFTKATQFPGYMMESTGSSIMVTPIPAGPFSEVSKGFTRSGLATQGMKLIKKENIKIGTAEGVLIHASQSAYGTDFLKWMLAFGDSTETTLVVATFPKQFEEQLSDNLKKSVLSVEWGKSMKLDFFEGFTFRVSESGSLKFANKIGNNVLLTEDGIFPQKEKGAPVVIVGASITQGWQIPSEKRLFSNHRLKQTNALMSPVIVIEEISIKINGLDGYLIYAEGVDKDTNKAMYIEQCLLFTDDGYYIFQALVDQGRSEEFKSHFSEIMQSFEIK